MATATNPECVDMARECMRLAGLTDDLEIRDRLLDVARTCMAIAMPERPDAERERIGSCLTE